jgi:hypothetical protein
MKITEIINEGGWASTATQGTLITPQLVAAIMPILQKQFIPTLNKFLQTKGIPPAAITAPAGSATYYKRDLAQDPTREYGDVDVQCSIAKLPNMSNAANASLYQKAIKEFCDTQQNFSTENGTNVIMEVGKDVVQVDLIMSYYENQAWLKTLAPEYRVKGVLCNSLYSSLGEALQLSFGGGHGIQAKTQAGKLVPFRTIKDVELSTIANNPDTWAVDICKYLGCTKLSPLLRKYPGTLDEVRTADIVQSFKGIAQSMEMSGKGSAAELLNTVKQIYLAKIQKAVESSKFDKASSPESIAKANATKQTLATKSAEIAKLF